MANKPGISSNPYLTSDSTSTLECIHGYSSRAIILGWLVYVVVHNVALLIVGILVTATLVQMGEPSYRIPQLLSQSFLFNVALIFTSFGGALLGGYMTARVALRCEVKHAVAMGILATLFALVWYVVAPDGTPMWANLSAIALIIPAAAFGAQRGASPSKSTPSPRS